MKPIKIILFLFTLLLLSNEILAQHIVVIDKDKENADVFDVNNPSSLIGMLSMNNDYLVYYNIEGFNSTTYNRLTFEELKDIVYYTSEPGTLPLIEEEPNSPNYGEYIIVTLPDGTESYIYDAPDTVYTTFNGISRITFEYSETSPPSTGHIMERINTISLWREFDSVPGFQNVMTLDARELMTMQGLKLIHKVDEVQTNQWVDPSKSNSLWMELKDAIFERINYTEESSGSVYDGIESFFPDVYSTLQSLNNEQPEWVNTMRLQERGHLFYDYEYSEAILPFSYEYNSLKNENINQNSNFHTLFDSCYYKKHQSDTPLIDGDPNSENFGEYLIVLQDDGSEYFVYPEPEFYYYWIDFTDIVVYLSEVFYEDENGVMRTKIGKLYFAKDNGTDKSSLVSYITVGEQLIHHLKDYKSKILTELPWHIQLQAAFADQKNLFDLSKPEDVKRYNALK